MVVLEGEIFKASEIERNEKALPCPFCGSSEIFYNKYQSANGTRWSIFCGGCIAEIDCGYAQQPSTARELWNKRANPTTTA